MEEASKLYKILEKIGEGGFGQVYKCRNRLTYETVAVKQIKWLSPNDEVPRIVMREINILKDLSHENIIGLKHWFHQKKITYLVFEYMDMDLLKHMNSPGLSNDRHTIKKFLHQILRGIAYCHSHNILHLDIKPKNILINLATNALKIADFGLSRSIDNLNETFQVVAMAYRAPELLLRCHYSMPVDVWSIGCIFAEMVTKKAPFFTGEGTEKDQLSDIFSVVGTPTEESWPGVTSLPAFCHHKFPCYPQELATYVPDIEPKGLDLLSKMLCCDPSKRIIAEEALKHAYFTDL